MSSTPFPLALLEAYESLQHRDATTAVRACLTFYAAGQPGGLDALEGSVLAALHGGAEAPGELSPEKAARRLRELAALIVDQNLGAFEAIDEAAGDEGRQRARFVCYAAVHEYASRLVAAHAGGLLVKSAAFGAR